MDREDELGQTIRRLVLERREQTEKEHVALEDLAAYYDRALKPHQVEAVEAHLAWCPGCLHVLQAFEELDQAMSGLAPPEDSPQQARASSKAEKSILAETDRRKWRLWRFWWFYPAVGLPAALVLFALISLWRPRPSSSETPAIVIAQAGVPSLDVDFSEQRSAEDPPAQIRLSGTSTLFVLVSWFPPCCEDAPLRATLLDPEARVAWRSEPFKSPHSDHFTLVLSRDLLAEQRYTLRLEEVGLWTTRIIGEREIEIAFSPTP